MNFKFKEKRNDTGHQRRIYMKFPSGLMALCFLLIWCRLSIHLPARQSLICENEILTPAKIKWIRDVTLKRIIVAFQSGCQKGGLTFSKPLIKYHDEQKPIKKGKHTCRLNKKCGYQ